MVEKISNYFMGLNIAGQALFVVGVLLILTFLILLVIVLKPSKNKIKKVYGESVLADKESTFEEKMRHIDTISEDDLNMEDAKTRNLKAIVDQLKELEEKNNGRLNEIEKYEAEQENSAIISVEELLRKTGRLEDEVMDFEDVSDVSTKVEEPTPVINEKPRYVERPEVYSSIYAKETTVSSEKDNENFLNSLKEFRNNL